MNHFALFNSFALPPHVQNQLLQKRSNPYFESDMSEFNLQKKLRMENGYQTRTENYNHELFFQAGQLEALLQLNLLNQSLAANYQLQQFNASTFPPLLPSAKNVIVIDDDESDSAETAAPLSSNPSPIFEEEISKNVVIQIEQMNEVEEEKGSTPTSPTAQIPSFCLNRKHRSLKRKSLKQVWNPEEINRQELENFFEELGRILRRKISSEQTALTLLQSFNMNIEKALTVIKRNKAQYQNLFNITLRCTRRSN